MNLNNKKNRLLRNFIFTFKHLFITFLLHFIAFLLLITIYINNHINTYIIISQLIISVNTCNRSRLETTVLNAIF